MEIYKFIEKHIAKRGYAPSITEIGHEFGLSSPATIHKHLTNLEEKGLIRRDAHRSRAIELTTNDHLREGLTKEYPLLGSIAAGYPIQALEDQETISILPEANDKDVFVLRVKGSSMIEDHIQDGDFVIVERRNRAENGETVVALIDNENATLKRFYREDNRVRLQPANPEMEPIYVEKGDFQIQGVVIGVMRKFN
jgi:repressor LexA